MIQSENKLMQEDENGQFYKEKISYFYEFIVSIFEMELCEINKKVCLDCFFYINENPIILESLKRNKGSDKENEIEIKNSQFLFDLLKYSTNDTYDFEDSRFRKILTVTPL